MYANTRLYPQTNTGYSNFVDSVFLAVAAEEGLRSIKGGLWDTHERLFDASFEVLASAQYEHNATDEALVRVGPAVAHLIQSEQALTVRIAAPDTRSAEQADRELRGRFPAPAADDARTDLRFWWSRPDRGPINVSRAFTVEPWAEVAANYAADTRASMEGLISLCRPEGLGRLILFHGEPGSGKTNAVLSLAREWSAWAQFEFVTDPERLFGDPGYLLSVVSRRSMSAGTQWQVLVLEDSGEFLSPYAKAENGQALSRLLNLADGALGTATRTLLLCTTNEELRELHPAASRAGRCLAQVAFTRLTHDEASAWCRVHDVAEAPERGATLAELYALRMGRSLPQREISVGFAA